MTPNELAEHNRWIAEHVFGYRPTDDPDKWTKTDETLVWRRDNITVFIGLPWEVKIRTAYSHTWHRFDCTQPAHAYELEQKIVEECGPLCIGLCSGMFMAITDRLQSETATRAEAVILLARKIEWK